MRTRLTEKHLQLGRSSCGGYNQQQLAALGVEWPPPKGWKQRVTGRLFEPDDIESFIVLRSQVTQSRRKNRVPRRKKKTPKKRRQRKKRERLSMRERVELKQAREIDRLNQCHLDEIASQVRST